MNVDKITLFFLCFQDKKSGYESQGVVKKKVFLKINKLNFLSFDFRHPSAAVAFAPLSGMTIKARRGEHVWRKVRIFSRRWGRWVLFVWGLPTHPPS